MSHADPLSSILDMFRTHGLTEGLARTRRTVRDTFALAGHVLERVERFVLDLERDGRDVALSALAFWRALEDAAREAGATARATPRVAKIVAEIGRLATVYRLHHIKVGWRSEEEKAAELEALHRREAERVRVFLQELGGGMLKVGQLLSARADLLPAAWIAELHRLQDQVPPAPEAEVLALLREELQALWPVEGDACEPVSIAVAVSIEAAAPADGAPEVVLAPEAEPDRLRAWLASFDLAPLAAASLAQVHRGTLVAARVPDGFGPEVAIKVQRPGIADVIAQDRRALALIAELVAPMFERFALAPVLTEVSRSLAAELDFAAEAAHARRFAVALAASGLTTRVPVMHAATPRMILMELVAGERLVPFLDAAGPEERAAILGELARTTAELILVHGLVHADPHPGNFLVARTADGRPELVLLDFGATVVLDDATRRAVVALLPALFSQNEAKVRELLLALGFSAPDPEAPALFAMHVARSIVPSDLANIDPRAELEKALALAQRYPGLVVPAAFVQIGRALAGIGGLFMTYRDTPGLGLDLGRVLLEALARASRIPSV